MLPQARSLQFVVYGTPQPQGSMRAFMVKGRPRITTDNERLHAWRQDVAKMALQARSYENFQAAMKDEPIQIQVDFVFQAPKKKHGIYKTSRPDTDKLLRGLCDALTGILFRDDSQVVLVVARKVYGDTPQTQLTVAHVS